jgi:hypothetical protein
MPKEGREVQGKHRSRPWCAFCCDSGPGAAFGLLEVEAFGGRVGRDIWEPPRVQ